VSCYTYNAGAGLGRPPDVRKYVRCPKVAPARNARNSLQAHGFRVSDLSAEPVALPPDPTFAAQNLDSAFLLLTSAFTITYAFRTSARDPFFSETNRRQLAFLLDYVLLFVVATIAGMAVGLMVPVALVGLVAVAVGLACNFLFSLKDGFNGQSPGKSLMGVQVLERKSLEPIGFRLSLMRHVPLLVMWAVPAFLTVVHEGAWLIAGLIASILLFYMGSQLCRGPRWGDKFAGTMVIWKKYRHRVPFDTRGALCVVCGYDLRGNVSGVCPECGRPIANPEAVPPAEAAGDAFSSQFDCI